MSTKSALDFAAWLRANHPKIYHASVKAADREVAVKANGLGQATVGPPELEAKTGWWETFAQTAAGLGSTYLSLKNQRDQMRINIERAQNGLPPLDIASTPIITTEVQLPPQTIEKITASAGTQINKILLFAVTELTQATAYCLKLP